MVTHLLPEQGQIDPRGEQVHRSLHREFRYGSLSVLESRMLKLGLDEIGSLRLPTGRSVRVRPLDVNPSGVLIAVDVEGSLKTDLRVPNERLVVIGAHAFQNGKLVISLQPRY